MLSVLLEFCNYVLQLLLVQHVFGEKNVLHDIMTTCIIMHNMITEDESDLNATIEDASKAPAPTVEIVENENLRFQQFLARHKQIKNKKAHIAFRNALIEHLWEQYSNSQN